VPVKLLRVQINTLMFIMLFIALNLTAVRPSILIRWGALPMVNVLLVGVVIGRRYRSARRFLWGFEAFGAMALAIYMTLDHLVSFQISTRYLNLAIRPYLDMRSHRLTAMNRVELNAIVVAMLGLPQLAVAMAGGVLTTCLLPAAVDEESIMRQRRLMWTAVGVLAVSTAAGLWVTGRWFRDLSIRNVTKFQSYSPLLHDIPGSSPAPGKIAVSGTARIRPLFYNAKMWWTVEVKRFGGPSTVCKYAFNDLRRTTWAPIGKEVTCKLDETLLIDLLPGTYLVYVELRDDARVGDGHGNILETSHCLGSGSTGPIEVK
jgi:hypothetical protein